MGTNLNLTEGVEEPHDLNFLLPAPPLPPRRSPIQRSLLINIQIEKGIVRLTAPALGSHKFKKYTARDLYVTDSEIESV